MKCRCRVSHKHIYHSYLYWQKCGSILNIRHYSNYVHEKINPSPNERENRKDSLLSLRMFKESGPAQLGGQGTAKC